MALLYLVGGLTAVLVVVLPHPPTLNTTVRLVVGGTAPVVALAVWSLRHRLPAAAYQWFLGLGSAMITLLVAASGTHSALVSTSFFYTWVVLYAVLFFSPASAAVQVGAVAVAYGLVLASSGSGAMDRITAMEPVALTSVIGTTALIVTILSRAREMSQVDHLTRVANRRGLEELLSCAMNGAARATGSLVVAMIDVDHFKTINDRDGHAAGDRLLQDLSRGWATVLRSGDVLARYGGDEFVVILPACTREDADTVLERVRTAARPAVTCSIGAATWQPGDSSSLLLGSADAALYQAKRLGRDRVAWADTP